jgi:hypothetical protein
VSHSVATSFVPVHKTLFQARFVVSIDHSAAALQAALRAFGETLGRALSEGITQGLQEGLSHSLDLEQLADRVPARAAQGAASGLQVGARRGGRPRGEARPCQVVGCDDPARSRGLCSRHYQQELRREKSAQSETPAPAPAAPSLPIEARPPIVRKRPEVTEPIEMQAAPPVAHRVEQAIHEPPTPYSEARREEIRSPTDAAKRIFG